MLSRRFIRWIYLLAIVLLGLQLLFFADSFYEDIILYRSKNVMGLPDHFYPGWNMVRQFFSFLLTILILYFFIRIIISLKKTTIFSISNIHHLEWIGYSYLAYSLVRIILHILVIIRSTPVSGDTGIGELLKRIASSIGETSIYVLYGLIVSVIAEIFRHGLTLKENQELTI